MIYVVADRLGRIWKPTTREHYFWPTAKQARYAWETEHGRDFIKDGTMRIVAATLSIGTVCDPSEYRRNDE